MKKQITPAIGEFAIEELSRVKAKLVEVKKERDELARLRAEDSWLPREQLAAAQAEIARLREAMVKALSSYSMRVEAADTLQNALATTSPTDALDAQANSAPGSTWYDLMIDLQKALHGEVGADKTAKAERDAIDLVIVEQRLES